MASGLRLYTTALLASLLLACSSGGDAPLDTGVGGDDPFGTPGATGRYVPRDDACKAYVDTITTKAAALGCTLTAPPKCPDVLLDFEKKSFPGTCVDGYDQGTIDNCKKRMATYTTCADFAEKPCELRVHPCGTGDAGPDTATDGASDVREASTTDAPPG